MRLLRWRVVIANARGESTELKESGVVEDGGRALHLEINGDEQLNIEIRTPERVPQRPRNVLYSSSSSSLFLPSEPCASAPAAR